MLFHNESFTNKRVQTDQMINCTPLAPAEMKAIDLALDAIAESEDDHLIIFSDSLSVLLSLQNKKMDNPLVVNLLYKLHLLSIAQNYIFLLDS